MSATLLLLLLLLLDREVIKIIIIIIRIIQSVLATTTAIIARITFYPEFSQKFTIESYYIFYCSPKYKYRVESDNVFAYSLPYECILCLKPSCAYWFTWPILRKPWDSHPNYWTVNSKVMGPWLFYCTRWSKRWFQFVTYTTHFYINNVA